MAESIDRQVFSDLSYPTKITRLERFLLSFKPVETSTDYGPDGAVSVHYKRLFGKIYVLEFVPRIVIGKLNRKEADNKMTYPRVYVSERTKRRVERAAKKARLTQKQIGDKIVLAGLRALGY